MSVSEDVRTRIVAGGGYGEITEDDLDAILAEQPGWMPIELLDNPEKDVLLFFPEVQSLGQITSPAKRAFDA